MMTALKTVAVLGVLTTAFAPVSVAGESLSGIADQTQQSQTQQSQPQETRSWFTVVKSAADAKGEVQKELARFR